MARKRAGARARIKDAENINKGFKPLVAGSLWEKPGKGLPGYALNGVEVLTSSEKRG
jgi:hypothetical protein